MHAVATGATHTGFGMGRTLEIGVCPCVASQARGVRYLRRCLAELKNLRHVAAAFDVSLARSVAALAGDSLVAVF